MDILELILTGKLIWDVGEDIPVIQVRVGPGITQVIPSPLMP